MRFEGDSVSVDFACTCQRENLKTARVGQDRTGPLHKLMQAAHLGHQTFSGAEEQVVGVCQHQLSSQFIELGWGNSFHRCLGADRSEDRGLQNTVGGDQLTGSG